MQTLVEVDLNKLVDKPVLRVLRFLSKSAQAEEPGGVAFVDGKFKIAGRVEECQLFTFRHI